MTGYSTMCISVGWMACIRPQKFVKTTDIAWSGFGFFILNPLTFCYSGIDGNLTNRPSEPQHLKKNSPFPSVSAIPEGLRYFGKTVTTRHPFGKVNNWLKRVAVSIQLRVNASGIEATNVNRRRWMWIRGRFSAPNVILTEWSCNGPQTVKLLPYHNCYLFHSN